MKTSILIIASLFSVAPLLAEEAKPADTVSEVKAAEPLHAPLLDDKGVAREVSLAELQPKVHYYFKLLDGHAFCATVLDAGDAESGLIVKKDGMKIPFELKRNDIAKVFAAAQEVAVGAKGEKNARALSLEEEIKEEITDKKNTIEIKRRQIANLKKELTGIRYRNRVYQINYQRKTEPSEPERNTYAQTRRNNTAREQLVSADIQYLYAQVADLQYDISILDKQAVRIAADKAAEMKRKAEQPAK